MDRSCNSKLVVISRFFNWLYYPNIEDLKRRNELSSLEKPDCIMSITKKYSMSDKNQLIRYRIIRFLERYQKEYDMLVSDVR
jgi:hypothetical protein